MKYYKMYVTTGCPYCVKVLQTMIDTKQTFYVEFMDSKLDLLNEAKEKYKHPTVPIVIEVDGDNEKLIGGCTEALRLIKGGKK